MKRAVLDTQVLQIYIKCMKKAWFSVGDVKTAITPFKVHNSNFLSNVWEGANKKSTCV